MAQIGGFWDSLTRSGRFAMQKVVGSNPIIRSEIPANKPVSFSHLNTKNAFLSQNLRPPSPRVSHSARLSGYGAIAFRAYA